MAKQPDKRNRDDDLKSSKGKGKAVPPPYDEDILEVEALEAEDYEDVEIIEAAEEPEPPSVKKTKLANKSPQPTMLAPAEEEPDLAKKTKLAKKSPLPTMLAPQEDEPAQESAKKTKLAKKSPQPTMLSRDAEDEVVPDAKQAASVPDLSIDDLEEVVAAAPASDVLDAEVAEVVEAAPVSDVLDADLAEVIETASASGVLDAEVEAMEILEAAPSSAVLGAEVEDEVGEGASKPPSSVVEAAAIVEEADEVLADEVLEAQQPSGARKGPETPPLKPASGVKEETPSGSIFADEILEVNEPSKGREAPTGSLDVFTAEIQDVGELGGPGSGTQHDEDVDLFGGGPASGTRKSKRSSAARAAESAIGVDDDEIFSAETLAEDFAADASSMQMKRPAKKKDDDEEKVLDVTETLPQVGGSSAIQWDDIGQVSDAKKKSDDEETIAFDTVERGSAAKRGKKASGLDMDEVSEVIEEIDEAAIEPPSKKKKISEDDIDFDDLVTEEEAAPSSKSGAKQAKADDEIEEIAADMFADDDGDRKPVSKKASKMLVDDEVEEIEEIPEPDLDEEPISSRRGGTALKRPPKPKYGRRWLGGIFLGLLLTAGGVAAVGYFKPELVEQGLAYSPEFKKPEPKKELSPSLQARESIEGGNFEQAIAVLDNAPKTPANSTALAEARWLKYVDEKKDKINRDDPEVKQILSNLHEAKDAKNAQALKEQIVAFFKTKDLSEQITKLQGSDKKLAEVAKLLKDPKDLPAAVAQVITENDTNKKLVDEFADALVKGMFLAKEDKDKLDGPAFQKIVKDLAEKQGVLAAVNKVLEDAMIKDPGDKGVTALVMAKKDVEDKLNAVDKLLAEEKLEPGAKGLQALFKARKKLTDDRDNLDKAIKAAFQELADAKVVPADADPRTKIAEETKLLRQKAESPLTLPLSALASSLSGLGTGTGGLLQKGFDYAALMTELNYYRVREPLLRGPEKNIDTHIALLLDAANFSNAAAVEAALKEAAWLLSDAAKSSPDTKGKAYLVQALALRQKQHFDDARTTLAQAIKLGQDGKATGAWLKQAERMEAELTDPAAYFLPRAQQLAAAGDLQGAQAVLTLGLKAIPNHGLLLAQRAQLRLDSTRGKLSVEAGQTIRSDAEAAAKDVTSGAAAAFVLGQLSEGEGDWAKAEKYYRQALKSHLGDADSGSRYRAALARVLLQDRPPVSTPVEPNEKGKDNKDKDEPKDKNKNKDEPKDKDAAKDKDKGKDKDAAKDKDKSKDKEKDLDKDKKEPDPKGDAAGVEQARRDLQTMLVLALVGVQFDDEEDPVVAARIKESIELANELIKSANPKVKGEGYLLLGQAMAKQGKRTEGLKEFSRGLELLYPGIATREMTKLIDEHPAFQQPDVSKQPNLFLAEQFFGRGLHLYFEKKYERAEKQFQQAVRHFGQDARYRYFLGLAQLAQKTKLKRDAGYFSFEEGARLEAANRPFVADINISLERIQGDLRQQLNGFRQKGLEKSE